MPGRSGGCCARPRPARAPRARAGSGPAGRRAAARRPLWWRRAGRGRGGPAGPGPGPRRRAGGRLVLRSLKGVYKASAVGTVLGLGPSPDPGPGAGVELGGGQPGGEGDLVRVGEVLPGQLEEVLVEDAIAGRGAHGDRLAVSYAEPAVDPGLLRPAGVLQRRLD